jgi:hypothetical protein
LLISITVVGGWVFIRYKRTIFCDYIKHLFQNQNIVFHAVDFMAVNYLDLLRRKKNRKRGMNTDSCLSNSLKYSFWMRIHTSVDMINQLQLWSFTRLCFMSWAFLVQCSLPLSALEMPWCCNLAYWVLQLCYLTGQRWIQEQPWQGIACRFFFFRGNRRILVWWYQR